MSDTPLFEPGDDVGDIETLLRELEAADHELTPPPDDVWLGIEAAIQGDAAAESVVVSMADRRSGFGRRFLAAAAAFVVLAAGAVVVASLRGGDDDVVVATARLAYDPEAFDPLGADAAATAQLVERDGAFEIRLDDATLPDPAENDLELWLISTDADGAITDVQPVSLVDASAPGTYAVPAELDPDVYQVVDISVEPRDGDEAHSGRSILRGVLDDV